MNLPPDLIASFLLAIGCAVLLGAHRLAGGPNGFQRVVQQGQTFVLGFNLMHAGFWMLQPVVRVCVRLGISPSAVTWLSLLPAAAGAVAAATGHWGLAAWCLLAGGLLDVLDGALARALVRTSEAGAVLDSALDRYVEFLFFAGVFIYYDGHLVVQALVMAALLGSFQVTYSSAKAEALGLPPPRGIMRRSDRLALMIVGSAFAPVAHQWFEAPDSRTAWPVVLAVAAIAVLANLSAILRFRKLAVYARTRAADGADVVSARFTGKSVRGRPVAPASGAAVSEPAATQRGLV